MSRMRWDKVGIEDRRRRNTPRGIIPEVAIFDRISGREGPTAIDPDAQRLWDLAHRPPRRSSALSAVLVSRLLEEWGSTDGVDADLLKLLKPLRKTGGVPGPVLLELMADHFDQLTPATASSLAECLGLARRRDSARFVLDAELARPGRLARKLSRPGEE
ncbi:hypothetical protein [Euzebya rosea]|uniref:hypothetical protein n=1 Tax=Euzebya rosea TaxID=2052804 RepID=UPI00130023A2|nr:hypothetical protein [Euzebya rosea]